MTAVALSPNGRFLVSAGTDGVARVLQPDSGRELWRTQLPDRAYWSAAFGPEGRTLALGRGDGKIELHTLQVIPAPSRLEQPVPPSALDEIGQRGLDHLVGERMRRPAKRRADWIGVRNISARLAGYQKWRGLPKETPQISVQIRW